jgi:hypothetical protein
MANFMTDRNVMHGMALECLDVGRDRNGPDVFSVLKFGAHLDQLQLARANLSQQFCSF